MFFLLHQHVLCALSLFASASFAFSDFSWLSISLSPSAYLAQKFFLMEQGFFWGRWLGTEAFFGKHHFCVSFNICQGVSLSWKPGQRMRRLKKEKNSLGGAVHVTSPNMSMMRKCTCSFPKIFSEDYSWIETHGYVWAEVHFVCHSPGESQRGKGRDTLSTLGQ